MTTACPWCGLPVEADRETCATCGGPLPTPSLPDPPRPVPGSYASQMLLTDSWIVVAGVLMLNGGVFALIGLGLSAFVATMRIGFPFMVIGGVLFGVGALLFMLRRGKTRQLIRLLKTGHMTTGTVTEVNLKRSVRVNHRHPAIIHYNFDARGRVHTGQATTWAEGYKPGDPVHIVYKAGNPQQNTLYPA